MGFVQAFLDDDPAGALRLRVEPLEFLRCKVALRQPAEGAVVDGANLRSAALSFLPLRDAAGEPLECVGIFLGEGSRAGRLAEFE